MLEHKMYLLYSSELPRLISVNIKFYVRVRVCVCVCMYVCKYIYIYIYLVVCVLYEDDTVAGISDIHLIMQANTTCSVNVITI